MQAPLAAAAAAVVVAVEVVAEAVEGMATLRGDAGSGKRLLWRHPRQQRLHQLQEGRVVVDDRDPRARVVSRHGSLLLSPVLHR